MRRWIAVVASATTAVAMAGFAALTATTASAVVPDTNWPTTKTFTPRTSFEIDGNMGVDGSSPRADWLSFSGPYDAVQPNGDIYPSAGIVASTSGTDNCVPTAEDTTGYPGSNTQDSDWNTGASTVNKKSDLCAGGAAIEAVDVNGQIHYIYYAYWTRSPEGTGDLSVFANLAGPADGRADDRLIEFDYAPSSNTAQVSTKEWRAPVGNEKCPQNRSVCWIEKDVAPGQFAYAVGANIWPATGGKPGANDATFGEIAVDLTAAGVLPSDRCATFTAAASISRTGNSASAELEDYVTYSEPLQLRSCNSLTIHKVGNPQTATGGPFEYVIDRLNGNVHDDTLLPKDTDNDATPATITETLTLSTDKTDQWNNILTGTDFTLSETMPLPDGWRLATITCTYTNIFRTGSPSETVTLYENGDYVYRTNAKGEFILDENGQKIRETFHVPSSTLGDGTDCTITNETSTLTIAKTGSGDTNTDFTFTVTGKPDQTLGLGESTAPITITPGTVVTITETVPDGTPAWDLTGIRCVNDETGSEVGTHVLADGSATVTTIGGANITCTFTNEQMARVRVAKTVQPTTATDSFTFAWGGGVVAGTEQLGHGETSAWYDVAAGSAVTVTETVTDGYKLGAVTCDDANSTGSVATATATFNVEAGESITCTFLNAEAKGSLTVIKNAVPDGAQVFTYTTTEPAGAAAVDDTFTLVDDGTPNDATTNSKTWSGLIGGEYSVTEGSVAGWRLTGLECRIAGGATTGTVNGSTATVTIGTDPVVCTFTNTRNSAQLTLTKAWPTAFPGDSVQLTTRGDDNTAQIVGSSVAGGTTVSAVRTVHAGEKVTLSESFQVKNGSYDTALTCTDAAGLSYTAGALTGTYTVPDDPENVTCTFSNTARTATLELAKDWMDSPLGLGAVDLTIDGRLADDSAVDSNVTEAGPHETASVTVLVGDTPRVSEVFTDGRSTQFITDLACVHKGTTDVHAVAHGLGATYGDVEITDADAGTTISCTFTNQRRSALVSFVKVWGNGAPRDTATFTYSGLSGANQTTTEPSAVPEIDGDPAWASTYVDTDPNHVLTTTIYGAETVTFGEAVDAPSGATYESQIRCQNEAKATIITFPAGQRQVQLTTPDRLSELQAADTDGDGTIEITCYVENIRQTADVFVQKAWTDGFTGDTATLTAHDAFAMPRGADTATSTATGAEDRLLDDPIVKTDETGDPIYEPVPRNGGPSNQVDYVNVAHAFSFTGSTVTIGETLTSEYEYSTAAPTCTYGADKNTVPVTVDDGGYTLDVPSIGNVQVWCTFENVAQRGTITVVKNVAGDDGTFTFSRSFPDVTVVDGVITSGGTDNFTLTTEGGTANRTWTNVPVGSYNLAEILSTLHDTTLQCTDSNADGTVSTVDGLTGTINLDAGETVVCTFTNTEKATLIVTKDAVPNDDQDFAFATTGPAGAVPAALASFTLDDDDDPTLSNTTSGLISANGAYSVSETAVPGWTLDTTTTQCVTTDAAGADVTITVDDNGALNFTPLPGATVNCIFVNVAANPELTVEKTTVGLPEGEAWTFDFGLTPHEPATFTITGSGSSTESVAFDDMVINTQYTITEAGQTGWEQSDFVCADMTDGANPMVLSDESDADGFQFTFTNPLQKFTCAVTNTAILPTVTLLKTVDNGTTAATSTDADWTLAATPAESTVPRISGVEGDESVTAAEVDPGSYTLSETYSGALVPEPDYYVASDWTCWATSAPESTWTVTAGNPLAVALGDDVTCEITNTATPGDYTYTKSSVPASGSTVVPGDIVTYTLTVVHTGGAPVGAVVLTDDVTDVIDDAMLGALPAGVTQSVDDGRTILTWTVGTLDPGDSPTTSYTATVNADARGGTLNNVVTSDRGTCDESVGCETEHLIPAWTLSKTSDPAEGTGVLPGASVRYTLTVVNTGPVALSGQQVVDDLSDVLDDATLVGDLSAGAVLDGTTLTWTVPSLAVGATTSLSYAVTVDDDALGETLRNVATPEGPGGVCLEGVDVDCTTEHVVAGWTLTKTSDPADGEEVIGGDEITYTLTVTNTSDQVLSGAIVTDDLSDVLDDAGLIGQRPDGASLDGTTVTWQVPDVPVGGTATLAYTVLVNEDIVEGAVLYNVASPGSPGGSCVVDCDTEHPTIVFELVSPDVVVKPPAQVSPDLAHTGADVAPMLALALALLLGGMSLLVMGKRRRQEG